MLFTTTKRKYIEKEKTEIKILFCFVMTKLFFNSFFLCPNDDEKENIMKFKQHNKIENYEFGSNSSCLLKEKERERKKESRRRIYEITYQRRRRII